MLVVVRCFVDSERKFGAASVAQGSFDAGVAMKYVNLGSTGLKVSRICLGTMTFGSPEWRNWVMGEAEATPFIKTALDRGINFFDTADVYSLGQSEVVLGNALRKLGVAR